jgi:hypothetical protein
VHAEETPGKVLSLVKRTKKRLRPFSPRRLGSPPPELPNYEMDIKELPMGCKRHFGNQHFLLVKKLSKRHAGVTQRLKPA